MAEPRTLEAREEKRSGASAPRRRSLGKVRQKDPVKEAECWMKKAVRLRNMDARKAIRDAETAAGYYLSASKKAFSERMRADCLVGAGKAISLAASVCEGIDARRAGRMHEDAGDYLFRGARGGTMPEAEVRELAKAEYGRALGLGGVQRIVERKIAMCERAIGE